MSRLLGEGGADGLDFEARENHSRQLALRTTVRLIENWLNADLSDHDGAGKPCACGGEARYAGRRRKRFTTALGPMTLNRADYHCPDCGRGFCPRDRALGLEGTSLSPGATRMTGFAAAETSFERSSQLLRALAGLAVNAKQVERTACHDTDHDLPPLAQRVAREAKRRGFDQAKRQVVLGDGAPWIWNTVSEPFPHAIQIVDLFHARQRLWKVAHDAYGGDGDLAAAWAHARSAELEAGRIGTVLAALRRRSGEEAHAAVGYFQNNRHRMRYARFRRQGLCVSSGVVESGCKQVVGNRLKRGGMHWTGDGGNAIIALKCCLLSHRFEDFWARRAQKTQYLVGLYTTTSPAPEPRDKTKKCA